MQYARCSSMPQKHPPLLLHHKPRRGPGPAAAQRSTTDRTCGSATVGASLGRSGARARVGFRPARTPAAGCTQSDLQQGGSASTRDTEVPQRAGALQRQAAGRLSATRMVLAAPLTVRVRECEHQARQRPQGKVARQPGSEDACSARASARVTTLPSHCTRGAPAPQAHP